MDVNQVFNEMTLDEMTEFIYLTLDFFEVDRTPLEAPPVDTSWLEMEDAQTGKPATTSWENVPQPAEPKVDDLRVTIKPGTHWGVWFHIEKYCSTDKWNGIDYDEVFKWLRVDKYLYTGYDKGIVERWSRDEAHAQARAAKIIATRYEQVDKATARKNRIQNGTYTYNVNPDR